MKIRSGAGRFTIDLPVHEPRTSRSGKTKLIANSRGTRRTDVFFRGMQVYVNAVVWIRREEESRRSFRKPKKTNGKNVPGPL